MTTNALPPSAPVHNGLARQGFSSSDDTLSKGLKWSFIAHGVFFFVIILKSLVFPSQAPPYIPSLRVDVVGLPDILKKDLAKVSKATEQSQLDAKKAEERQAEKELKPKIVKAAKIKEMADPNEVVLKPKQQSKKDARDKKLKNALARIKALEKISDEPAPKAVVVRGNAVSKGTSLSGDAKETSDSAYFDAVRNRLLESWALPVWIARQNLSAKVKIYIDARGRVHGMEFIKTSGNPQFDSAVKKAIADSDPFPVPPTELINFVLVNGITFGFPL